MTALKTHVGEATLALLAHLRSGVETPGGFADLIVRQRGIDGVLRSQALRELTLRKLTRDEGMELCEALNLPSADPITTLCNVPFDTVDDQMSDLFGWFGQPFEPSILPDDKETRRGSVSDHLQKHQWRAFRDVRQRLGEQFGTALVRMPPTAGKLRVAATALVDFYRSAPEETVVLWLAHHNSLCAHAFEELHKIWQAFGSREIVLHRFFGAPNRRGFDAVGDGIVVANVETLRVALSNNPVALDPLATRLKAIVLHEATSCGTEPYQVVLAALRGANANVPLVGLSSAPEALEVTLGKQASIKTLFPSSPVMLNEGDEQKYLQSEGLLGLIEFVAAIGLQTELVLGDNNLDIDDNVVSALTSDAERNSRIFECVREEVSIGRSVALFLASAEQARVFVAVLPVYGHLALAVTGDAPPDRQEQLIRQFQASDRIRVLCIHDVLVAQAMAPKIDTAIIARPTTSPMMYGGMIGRLAERRPSDRGPLKVITFIDALPGFPELVAAFARWSKTPGEETRR